MIPSDQTPEWFWRLPASSTYISNINLPKHDIILLHGCLSRKDFHVNFFMARCEREASCRSILNFKLKALIWQVISQLFWAIKRLKLENWFIRLCEWLKSKCRSTWEQNTSLNVKQLKEPSLSSFPLSFYCEPLQPGWHLPSLFTSPFLKVLDYTQIKTS